MERNLHYQHAVSFSPWMQVWQLVFLKLIRMSVLYLLLVRQRERERKKRTGKQRSLTFTVTVWMAIICSPTLRETNSSRGPFLSWPCGNLPRASLLSPQLPSSSFFILHSATCLFCCSPCSTHESWNAIIISCRREETNNIAFCTCVCWRLRVSERQMFVCLTACISLWIPTCRWIERRQSLWVQNNFTWKIMNFYKVWHTALCVFLMCFKMVEHVQTEALVLKVGLGLMSLPGSVLRDTERAKGIVRGQQWQAQREKKSQCKRWTCLVVLGSSAPLRWRP